jgi:flagellar hook-associated protein 1 FlgK
MSISDILNIATSGLSVAQTQVSATSDNIANVNTTGYARKIVNQSETVVDGRGLGVHIDSVQSAYNAFLQKASLAANSQASQTAVVSNFLTQAQQMFGDPSSTNSFFGGLDNVYSALSAASDTPSSTLSRTQALNALNNFLTSASNLSTNLSGLRDQANQQTTADVSQVNNILAQISQTDGEIARIGYSGGDTSGLTNNLAQLQDRLSKLMQVQVSPDGSGGISVRSQEGVYLTGPQGPATLSFTTAGAGGLLTATPPKGQPMQISAGGGEISGLMQLAGVTLPQMMTEVSQYVSQAVSQLNAAHNDSSSVPAPNRLTGQSIGMALPTAIGNFSGKTTIAITDASGVIQQRVDITFGFGTGSMNVTDNTGATSTLSFTPANFLTQLNTALGTEGGASFSNGVLSIAAATSTDGVAITDDPTTPSSNGASTFGQFFGLNNLVQSTQYANTTGALGTSSPNTFTGGVSLELTDSTGAAIRQINLSVSGAQATMGDVINSLNAGITAYGFFAMDGQGHLAFNPASAYAGSTVSVISDNTSNAAGSPSMSQMLGLGWTTQAALTSSYSIRSDIAANPGLMSLAQLDLSQTVNGQPALGVGDGRGAAAMANSGATNIQFSPAGALSSMVTTVSSYGSQLAGQIGSAASNASDSDKSAQALLTQANAQRSAAEGVNLDNELVNLTTYQQSYNACARLIQASKDMYQVLLQMI